MAKKIKSPLKPAKGIIKALLTYREMRARGQVSEVSELETLSKYVTKTGGIKKRETRYAPGREAVNKAIDAARKALGSKTPGRSSVTRAAKAQKDRERLAKAAKTYAQKNIPDNRFKRLAREKTDKYYKMVEVFASDTYNTLRDAGYGLTSGVVEALVNELNGRDLTGDEIAAYLEQVISSLKDIPTAARALATQDDFYNAVIELSQSLAGEDSDLVKDIMTTYLTTEYNREDFQQALTNYIEIGQTDKSFKKVWEEMNRFGYDPTNYDTMYEIINEE